MDRIYFIDWIDFDGIRAWVNQDLVTNWNQGIICFGSDQLLETGQPITNSENRTLREGTILPPKTLRAGKSFTLNLYIYGSKNYVTNTLETLQTTLYDGHFDINTNIGGLRPNVIESMTITEETKKDNSDFFILTVNLQIQSASPTFNYN